MSQTHQFVIAAVHRTEPATYWTGKEWGTRDRALPWNFPSRAYATVRTIPPVPGREIIVKAK